MVCSVLIIFLPSWGPEVSVSIGGTGSLGILKNADTPLVQETQISTLFGEEFRTGYIEPRN